MSFLVFNFYGFYLDIFLEFVVIFEDKGCFVVGWCRVFIYLEFLYFCKGNYV